MKTTAFIIILLLFFSCTKKEVNDNTFTVTTDKTTYKKGDTINFTFTGNPDFISFYSGEVGHVYDLRERKTLSGRTLLQFTSYKQNGTQPNSLQLLVSSDFNGTYTKAGIAAATWTNITSRATLSIGADNTPSGAVDISDFVQPYKNFFFAFRKIDANSATDKPNQWTIKNFSIDVKQSDSSLYSVATIGNPGWTAVDSLNATYKWTVNTASLVATGGGLNTAANEDWVITKVLTPLNVVPDASVAVKWIDTKRLDTYSYSYNTPGIYKAVFVAANQNIYSSKAVTKEMVFTITP